MAMATRSAIRRAFKVALAVGLLAPASAIGEEQAEADDADDAERAVEEMIVTGSRLVVDPTSRVLVVTAEDIAARGLSSAEEVIRSLPHNFSTINSFTNLNFGSDVLDTNLGALGLGISSANLRGLGSRNTLVLVNGRRIAGAAGNQDFFANISHIPAAAIDRVEVLLDGGGSIYGSDAIGGVINVVLKQDFTGGSVSARTENSSTEGDRDRLAGQFGYSWEGGSISTTISRTETESVVTTATGYTTRDYSPRFGGDETYNFIGTRRPRSAVVGLSRWGPFNMILPPGNDGRNAQRADFVPVTPADYLDWVPDEAGGGNEQNSILLNVRHEFFESVTLQAELLRTRSESHRRISTFGFSSLQVPESNAFNNFGQDVYVRYDASTEIELGLLSSSVQTDVSEQERWRFGVEHAVSPRWTWHVDYVRSTTEGAGVQYMFGPDSGTLDDEQVDARLAELLSSADPSMAVNFFGDGTGQNPTIAEFHVGFAADSDRSSHSALEFRSRANVYELPSGWINFVAGGEVREEAVEDLANDFEEQRGVGVKRPSRDLTAFFAEALVPIFAKGNERRGLRELNVKIAARRDSYETEGAVGDLPVTEPGAAAMPNIVKAEFSSTTMEFGVNWRPVRELELTLKHSEGFRAPRFSQLFSRFALDRQGPTWDPLTRTFPFARSKYGSNPDLKPETSQTLNVGVSWTPAWGRGLLMTVDYSDVDIRDRLASSSELSQLLPVEEYAWLPQFFERAEDGTLISSTSTTINIARRVSQNVDIHISKPFDTDIGRFSAELEYSRVLDQYDQAVPGSAKAAFVGESVGVDRYKLKGAVTWYADPTSVTMTVNHRPGYVNNDFENSFFRNDIPNMPVASYTTVDITAKHRFDMGLTVRAGGRNVFDKKPPFMLSSSGQPYDARRVDLRRQVLFVELAYDFDFGK